MSVDLSPFIKSPDAIKKMRVAGRKAASVLELIESFCRRDD